MKSSTGQNIRRIRLRKELTQDNLAYELGITKGAYSKIERDATNVSINRLKEIAKILEVDVIEFLRDSTEAAEVEQKNQYGFATKGDIEEIVKMIQNLAKEVHTLKTSLNKKSGVTAKTKEKK